MKKISVSIFSAVLMLSMVFSTTVMAANDDASSAGSMLAALTSDGVSTQVTSDMGVQYRAHIQDVGDFPADGTWVTGPIQIGTPGLSRRIEGIEIKLTGDIPAGAKIVYNLHVQDYGWLADVNDPTTWQEGPAYAGTRAESKRIEAIQIELLYADGTKLDGYSVQYSGHVQNVGDVAAVADGKELGTVGAGQRLEGLKVQIVQSASLVKYNAALAAVTQTDYTTASWAAYQQVVAANVVTLANTQAKIDVATAAITAAQKDILQKLADLSKYNAAVNAVTEDQVKSGWATYKAVLDANVMTAQNKQLEVDNATAKILSAQKNLTLYSDMTAFNKAIAPYVKYGADAENAPYTTATWNAYTAQCELYGTLKDGVWQYDVVSKNSTQATVDAAEGYISAAAAKLVATTDLTAFNAAKAIKITDGPYTTASFEAYTKDAVVVYITGLTTEVLKASTQGVVDSYTESLLNLQQKLLVRGSDISKYEAALALVKPADYTSVSWATYQTVVNNNVVTSNSAQAVVDAATATVLEAQKSLIYGAAYVVANGQLNSASFEVQHLNDNVLTRAKALMTANGLDVSNYLVTFTRVDAGTAVINPTTGLITNVGTGTATVTFTITPVDGSAAATTTNVVLVLK